ncbi:MAG: hypothetical protein WCL70_07970 [Paludibacter sp.]
MGKDIRLSRERVAGASAFYGKNQITPQRTLLRIEVDLVDGQGIYAFDIKKKGKDKSITERSITDNDLFVVDSLGLALTVEKDAAPGTAPLLSYPLINGLHLPAGIKGFTDNHAYAVYNGILSVKTDQTVNISAYPTANFLRVPQTQPVGVLTSEDVVVTTGIQPEFDLDSVLTQLSETLVFAGNHETEIKLEAPVKADVTLGVPADYTGKAVLLVDGWLFAGGAKPQYAIDGNPFKNAI